MKVRYAAALGVMLLSLGCGPRGPILGTATKPEGVGGTISGIVSANDGTTAIAARTVTAINMETGARFDTSTATNGGYTIKVPKGMYRLELELRPGETIATQPSATEINTGDLDSGRNFVVNVGRSERSNRSARSDR
jgi:hypothetical protein